MKKKKKSQSRNNGHKNHGHHHDDKSFLIIVGGGFLVILISLFLFGDQSKNLFSFISESSELSSTPIIVEEDTVVIENGAVNPEEVTIAVGETVTWQNSDSVVHTLTADDGSFTTTPIAVGDFGTATFTTAGTYNYSSNANPNLVGVVVVEEAMN